MVVWLSVNECFAVNFETLQIKVLKQILKNLTKPIEFLLYKIKLSEIVWTIPSSTFCFQRKMSTNSLNQTTDIAEKERLH